MAPSSTHNNGFYVLMLVGIVVSAMVAICAASFYQDFDPTWVGDRAKIFNGGQLLSLSLDKVSGSGFKSKKEYLFGKIDMQLKLIAGNSAGTVTAYYVRQSLVEGVETQNRCRCSPSEERQRGRHSLCGLTVVGRQRR